MNWKYLKNYLLAILNGSSKFDEKFMMKIAIKDTYSK